MIKQFCHYLLGIIILLCSHYNYAFTVQTFYTGSCAAHTGLLTAVDNQNAYVLATSGKIITIPRYKILAIANYSAANFPLFQLDPLSIASTTDAIVLYTIFSKKDNKIVELVSGYPIAFSANKISFLTMRGKEITIKRDDIWEITQNTQPSNISQIQQTRISYNLVQPALFRECDAIQLATDDTTNASTLSPQNFLSDTISIKKTLDTFKQEQRKLYLYQRNQKFYPVPQIFHNQTLLGVWLSINSRYGSNDNRANNGAPILESQFSTGPFGYQHIWLTGSAPNPLLIHAEAQTQIFYSFKADYFHMSFLIDPNNLLLEDKYNWQEDELANNDDRLTNKSFIDLGLDFGNFSIFVLNQATVAAWKANNGYFQPIEDLSLTSGGISYHNPWFKIQLISGNASQEKNIGNDRWSYDARYTYQSGRIVADGDNPKGKFIETSYSSGNTYRYTENRENSYGYWNKETQYTTSGTDKLDLSFNRLNLDLFLSTKLKLRYSLISRELTANYSKETVKTVSGEVNYEFSQPTYDCVYDPISYYCTKEIIAEHTKVYGNDYSLNEDPVTTENIDTDYSSKVTTHALYANYLLNHQYTSRRYASYRAAQN